MGSWPIWPFQYYLDPEHNGKCHYHARMLRTLVAKFCSFRPTVEEWSPYRSSKAHQKMTLEADLLQERPCVQTKNPRWNSWSQSSSCLLGLAIFSKPLSSESTMRRSSQYNLHALASFRTNYGIYKTWLTREGQKLYQQGCPSCSRQHFF